MAAPPSRLSSPLSEFTPSPPPTAAPPSPSISSDSSAGEAPASEVDELALDDDDEPGEGVQPGTGGAKKRAFAEIDDHLQPAPCQWGDCAEEFWELEPLIEHLHNGTFGGGGRCCGGPRPGWLRRVAGGLLLPVAGLAGP